MINKLPALIFLTFFSNFIYSQQKQTTYYLTKDNTEVQTKDSADFIRVIRDPDSNGRYFSVIEVYPNEKIKSLALSPSHKPIRYEGQFISYYTNGKIERRSSYENNKLTGKSYEFYPNGKTKWIKDYGSDTSYQDLDYKMVHFADSTGQEQVKDGSGHFFLKHLNEDNEEIIEEGDYKNGLKTGTWSVKYTEKNWRYREEFDNGTFKFGQSQIDSIIYRYSQIQEPIDCAGGLDILYKRMVKTLEYPKDAYKANVTGKVFLSFVVDSDGTPGHVKIERKAFPSLDREAKRIVSYAIRVKWKPQRKHGIPIKTMMNVPVNFSLNTVGFLPDNDQPAISISPR